MRPAPLQISRRMFAVLRRIRRCGSALEDGYFSRNGFRAKKADEEARDRLIARRLIADARLEMPSVPFKLTDKGAQLLDMRDKADARRERQQRLNVGLGPHHSG